MQRISGVLALMIGSCLVAAPALAAPACTVEGKAYNDLKGCKAALERAERASMRQLKQREAAAVRTDVKVQPVEKPPSLDTKIFIRRSMDDLGSFASPNKLAKSAGAEFAWSRNGINGNDTWSARGLVGARFLSLGGPAYVPYVDHSLLAVYVEFDRVINTKLKANDVDDLTFGLSSEIALANFLQATHYLRTRGEIVTDFNGNTKNWNVAWDYMPFGNPSPEGPNSLFAYIGTPLPMTDYFFVTVTPKMRAEYRGSMSGATDPIFATHDRVFRVGPAVTLAIDGNSVFSDVPWFLQGTHFQITYGWLHDLVSNRDYRLLDTSLTFNLHPQSLLGLTFSYRRGELDATGAKVDLAKVALTAKLGQ